MVAVAGHGAASGVAGGSETGELSCGLKRAVLAAVDAYSSAGLSSPDL